MSFRTRFLLFISFSCFLFFLFVYSVDRVTRSLYITFPLLQAMDGHIQYLATESHHKAVGKSNAELKLHIVRMSVSTHCWNEISISFSSCHVKKL